MNERFERFVCFTRARDYQIRPPFATSSLP
jgi:hypothetical protein